MSSERSIRTRAGGRDPEKKEQDTMCGRGGEKQIHNSDFEVLTHLKGSYYVQMLTLIRFTS